MNLYPDGLSNTHTLLLNRPDKEQHQTAASSFEFKFLKMINSNEAISSPNLILGNSDFIRVFLWPQIFCQWQRHYWPILRYSLARLRGAVTEKITGWAPGLEHILRKIVFYMRKIYCFVSYLLHTEKKWFWTKQIWK